MADLDKLRADFEAIAPEYDISVVPPPPMVKRDPAAPFKYVHSNHLFAIFCEGAARRAVPAQASAPAADAGDLSLVEAVRADIIDFLRASNDTDAANRVEEFMTAAAIVKNIGTLARPTAVMAAALPDGFKLLTKHELFKLQKRLIDSGTYDYERFGAEVECMTLERAGYYRAAGAMAGDLSELEFNATRLRNVAQLVGLGSAIPQDDATLDGARGAVLGRIARVLRARVDVPGGEMPPLPDECELTLDVFGYTADQMHAYVLADRAQRASAVAAREAKLLLALQEVNDIAKEITCAGPAQPASLATKAMAVIAEVTAQRPDAVVADGQEGGA